jgi:SAM-dependent methyltransferase
VTETLRLSALVDLPPPAPWADGDNIPWHEPGFSARMLREHLSQHHDAASRRGSVIDQQVDWIHRHVLGERPARVLDLGCGPGLYTSRLARLGHTCVGIDYSPASIEYAREEAKASGLSCEYRCEDIREAEFGAGCGLVILIFGELNVFRPVHAREILGKARAALAPGGTLLLEPHTFAAVEAMAARPRHWYAAAEGLFSDRPHLCLQEQYWDAAARAMTRRYAIVDADTSAVGLYAQTLQAYTEADYRSLLAECGFAQPEFELSLSGKADAADPGLCVIVAKAE